MQVGVFLSKELMNIAARSLKANITTLGPLVLPWTEQARFLANFFCRKVSSWSNDFQQRLPLMWPVEYSCRHRPPIACSGLRDSEKMAHEAGMVSLRQTTALTTSD